MLRPNPAISGYNDYARHFDLDYKAHAKIIVALVDIPQPWILSTDRTEWYEWTNSFQHFDIGYSS